jgi:hypothetical protein
LPETIASTSNDSSAVDSQGPRRIFSLFEKTSFPDSDFKHLLLNYATDESLLGPNLIASILEEYSTLSARFSDRCMVKKTICILRDLLLERGCIIDHGRGVQISMTIVKALYSKEQLTPKIDVATRF